VNRFFASVALAVIAVSVPSGPITAAADPGAESMAKLKAGNARFVSNPEDAVAIEASRRSALAGGQAPYATILSCADSRVPPEIVFHAGLGDLFVVRAAGNVTDRAILASVEYAAEHLHTPLIVVMGHESCGAVKAASETPASKSLGPNLDYMLKAIRPSVAATRTRPEADRLRAAILENVEETLNSMVKESAILRDAGRAGHVTYVGAYYELSSGKVYFSEPADVASLPAAAAKAKPSPALKPAQAPASPAGEHSHSGGHK
jgi:carbonic anhydrase